MSTAYPSKTGYKVLNLRFSCVRIKVEICLEPGRDGTADAESQPWFGLKRQSQSITEGVASQNGAYFWELL